MARKQASPVTDAERDQIIVLGRQGVPRNEIVRITGRAGATVTEICRKAVPPVRFDRAMTAQAVEAAKADAALMRAEAAYDETLILRALQRDTIAVLRGQKKHRTLIRAAGGAERETELNFMPSGEARNLSQARAQSVTIINNLTRSLLDESTEDDRRMLVDIATALGRGNRVRRPDDSDGLDPEAGGVDPQR